MEFEAAVFYLAEGDHVVENAKESTVIYSLDDTAGIATLSKPSVLIPDAGEVVERELDRDMFRCVLLELDTE